MQKKQKQILRFAKDDNQEATATATATAETEADSSAALRNDNKKGEGMTTRKARAAISPTKIITG